MANNKLIIAAAGSGKTTHLVNEALNVKTKNVLITTYTEANEAEIKRKFIKSIGYIPSNIIIQTWFSFLLKHGVRPYQDSMHEDLFNVKIGFVLSEKQSALRFICKGKPVYWGEDHFFKHYFTKDFKIFSDKVSKFIVKCNSLINGEIINRISRIFEYIYIDEVQDLAGYDLDIIQLLLKSKSSILMVGDPRQVTYVTHHSRKNKKYLNGKIKEYMLSECNEFCDIDEHTLRKSHRNNLFICHFSSSLFPDFSKCEPCDCAKCHDNETEHQGVFLVRPDQVDRYLAKYKPIKLHYSNSEFPDLNFGLSKGMTFDRVLIFPTSKMNKYLHDGNVSSIETIRAKFYVALTRARYSVGIVCDYTDSMTFIDGIQKYTTGN